MAVEQRRYLVAQPEGTVDEAGEPIAFRVWPPHPNPADAPVADIIDAAAQQTGVEDPEAAVIVNILRNRVVSESGRAALSSLLRNMIDPANRLMLAVFDDVEHFPDAIDVDEAAADGTVTTADKVAGALAHLDWAEIWAVDADGYMLGTVRSGGLRVYTDTIDRAVPKYAQYAAESGADACAFRVIFPEDEQGEPAERIVLGWRTEDGGFRPGREFPPDRPNL